MKNKLEEYLGDGNIVIPLYILKSFKKLNITMEEFIFLMYLYNRQDKIDFNPEKIASDLNIDIMEVMGYISVLSDKGFLSLDIIKDNNVIDEVINLSLFYEKISFLLMTKEDASDNKKEIFKDVSSLLGRNLTEIEEGMIQTWLDNKIDESLIEEGIKIAINDGVYSLKYIDKMLFDFKNRGITKPEEINNNTNNIDTNNEPEIDDWNWLDEEEYITN